MRRVYFPSQRFQIPDKLTNLKTAQNPAGRRADHFRYLLSRQKGVTGLTRSSFCMISTENEVVVDPYGDIYKCYDEAGREEYKVGEPGGQIKWFECLRLYLSRNISTMEQCSTCSVALACMAENVRPWRKRKSRLLYPVL